MTLLLPGAAQRNSPSRPAVASDRTFPSAVRALRRLGPRPPGKIVAAVPVVAERLEVHAQLDPRTVDRCGADDRLEPVHLLRAVVGGLA